MINKIDIDVDHEEIKALYLEKLDNAIKQVEVETLFWDTKELERQTHMCMNTIQKEFFYDPNFPKKKVGNKWYYPAQKTREFLIEWIEKNN